MNNAGYVIFDLDGTIIDSFESACKSLSLTLESLSLPVPSDDFYEPFRDKELSALFRATYAHSRTTLPWKVFKRTFDEVYSQHCMEGIQVIPLGNQIIELCRCKLIDMVVVTNKTQPAADIVCASLFPSKTFVSVIGRNGVRPIKPYKYAINKLIKRGFPVESCKAYFGDSGTDEKLAALMKVKYYDIHQMDEKQIQTLGHDL